MNLTSPLALSTLSSPTKRKATAYEDDSENVDPIIFFSPKKSKGSDGTSNDTTQLQKPVNFFLTKAPPSPNDFSAALKPTPVSPRRPILPARSPAPRINTKSIPLSAPAGRSPTRKRIGILNRRKTASPFTRVDPPKFGAPSSSLGFSIDAALSGTIPSYSARQRQASPVAKEDALPIPVLYTPAPKDSWFFDIHEDTPEELATNLMEHSTCTLDISSDEESASRLKDERGKENIPPLDDISQTRIQVSDPVEQAESSMASLKAEMRAQRRRREVEEGACDVDRVALGEMAAEDFWAEGCDGESVFLVPSEEDIEAEGEDQVVEGQLPMTFDFVAEVKGKGKEVDVNIDIDIDIDTLMSKDGEVSRKAALLEPIEKAEEGFQVWESGSDKGEGEEVSL